MRKIDYICIIILSFLSINGFAQTKSELQNFYKNKISIITDSAIEYNKVCCDSVYSDVEADKNEFVRDFNHYRDSILLSYHDSLNVLRKDSVKIAAGNIKNTFDLYYNSLVDTLKSSLNNFIHSLNNQKENNKNCLNCKDKQDFNDGLDDFRDLMDSLSDNFQEKFALIADTIYSMAGDSLESCKDSLLDYTQDLVDNQSDENETMGKTIVSGKVFIEPSNELDVGVVFDSHYSYRGRDNGIKQFAVAPSVQYQHISGFGVFIDLEFLNKSKSNPDGVDGGISWLFNISESFNIQLLYTHFLFTDSSKEERAALNNNIESVFSLETKYFNSNITLDLDFGGGVREAGISFYGGFPVQLSKKFLKGTLTFEPNLTIVIGEQNFGLALQRRLRQMGINIKKSASTFGIMDYEIGIPLTLETKHLIVKPVYYIIIPVNVLDLSTKKPFGDFSLELTVPFRF